MKNCKWAIFFVYILIISCQRQTTDLTKYINPFIGTTNSGNQSPGPHCPFSMMELSPLTMPDSVLSSTFYQYGDPFCYGFSLVNIIGSGCTSYGSVIISAQAGKADITKKKSTYCDQEAKVGYYHVFLKEHHINAEMTSTVRCSIIKFTLPKGNSSILIDLSRINTQDTAFMLKWISSTELEGFRTDGQFCGKPGVHRLYFYIKIDNQPNQKGLLKNNMEVNAEELNSKRDKITAFATYQVINNSALVELRSGISYVSVANARENVEKEIANKSFDSVRKECCDSWQTMLSRIEVEGASKEDKTKFYTALYHTMSHPNIINDINGDYPAMETMKTMKVKGRNRFSVYSLWDTYRTLHPFLTLAYPEIQSQMVNTMIDMYKEYGWLPHWECISREKGVMNGDPALIVINDSWQKGIRDFNTDTALMAMIHNTKEVYTFDEQDRKKVQYIRKGMQPYWQYNGYIPQDYKQAGNDIWGVVATTEEYNLADWNLAQFANSLGRNDIYNTYLKLSQGYQFFYDSSLSLFRCRYANGRFVEPFNALATSGEMPWPGSGGPGYTEGHAWHYRFFVPHDMNKLIQLMGEKKFIDTLQACFDKGYYMPDNEPDLAYPFLFNYVKGEQWRTEQIVRKLIEKEFLNASNGIPGNDDTGTMSAWLLFAMMGLYPDCPGLPQYQICSPVFDKITIHLNNKYYKGKTFVIVSKNNSKENKFIQSLSLNDKLSNKFTLNHFDIVNGGKMIIELGSEHKQ